MTSWLIAPVYLYLDTGSGVTGYSIDATTGLLAALSGFPVAAGSNADSLTTDPTNQFLYVTNEGSNNVTGFQLDASTGKLTPMIGSPFAAGHSPDFITTL
jgi:6-phosphogluconolactonase (cycloisomerase 2 family)